MLCVYRPSITAVAGVLQRTHTIQYERGYITILDRSALEATACDCYSQITPSDPSPSRLINFDLKVWKQIVQLACGDEHSSRRNDRMASYRFFVWS